MEASNFRCPLQMFQFLAPKAIQHKHVQQHDKSTAVIQKTIKQREIISLQYLENMS